MQVERELKSKVSFVAIPICKDARSLPKLGKVAKERDVEDGLRKVAQRALREKAFAGDGGETLPLLHPQPRRIGGFLLWGLGEKEKLTLDSLRRVVGVLARSAAKTSAARVAVEMTSLQDVIKKWGADTVAEVLTSGWQYGSYSYKEYQTNSSSPGKPPNLVLLTAGLSPRDERLVRSGSSQGRVVADAVSWARDLGNAPANALYPDVLARRARTLANGRRVSVKVLGPAQMRRLRMGCLLGVAQGSSRPPRLIVIHYRPTKKAKKTIALVGKAITFDSGGLSLKPAKSMEEMKFDMCGGASVLGAMKAVAALRLPVEVVGIIPASENMVNGSAVRPGDVLRASSGTTVEVVNTDAEGRLVLADALHYARRFKPNCILDFATLTGAIVIALGGGVTGLISNNRDLAAQVYAAGEDSGDRVWELPLYEEYVEAIRSQVADIRNSSGREAGAITAGAFLSRFVGDTPWCHLDIAGTGWSSRERSFAAAGATGAGVSLAVAFLRGLGT